MSDLLTHWAVFEDICRIAGVDPRMAADLIAVVRDEREFARLGSVSRGGVRFVPHVLRGARDAWSASQTGGGKEHEMLQRKVAYAMGGIAHYPADYILKTLMGERAGANWNDTHHQMQRGEASREAIEAVQEISVYYDLKVFREVYLAGKEEPFNRFLLAENETDPGTALEEFVRTLFQRALLASHTLAPDGDDLDSWLENLITKVQPLYLDVERYVRIFRKSDPQKAQAYGVDTAFYATSDPVIGLARAVQNGEKPGTDRIDAAIAEGANESGYGRAVALGAREYRNASRFWTGETNELPDVSQG